MADAATSTLAPAATAWAAVESLIPPSTCTLRLNPQPVHVAGQGGTAPHRLDDHGPDGDLWHKPAVHHVHVDGVGATPLRRADLLTQPGEVGAEDAGGNAHHAGHGRTSCTRRPWMYTWMIVFPRLRI